MPSDAPPVPFTVLTGFLGAGKTTTLNRLLAAPVGRRVAVLINDLGRINVDRSLIRSSDGDLLELSGGCVCCRLDLLKDLWTGIDDLVARARPSHVVLETTGIAEPQVLVAALSGPTPATKRVALAGVVCVVDAADGLELFQRRPEPRAQVEAADRLVLTKLDLADPARLSALHALLDRLNPGAERAAFPLEVREEAQLAAYVLDRREPRARPADGHPHGHGQLAAVAHVDEAPLLGAPLVQLLDELAPRLLRAKGLVRLAGQSGPWLIERAGARLALRPAEVGWPGAPRSELVLIGEGLDDGEVRRRLWACRAPLAAPRRCWLCDEETLPGGRGPAPTVCRGCYDALHAGWR